MLEVSTKYGKFIPVNVKPEKEDVFREMPNEPASKATRVYKLYQYKTQIPTADFERYFSE